jgi:hypothetical protein
VKKLFSPAFRSRTPLHELRKVQGFIPRAPPITAGDHSAHPRLLHGLRLPPTMPPAILGLADVAVLGVTAKATVKSALQQAHGRQTLRKYVPAWALFVRSEASTKPSQAS